MRFLSGLFILFILHITSIHAQEIGRLPYKNFSHRDYVGHYQNWAVIQDNRGLIYSANNGGVLEYDGTSWRTISINGAAARCLDTDSNGRVWVGGQDEMGYLAPDSLGFMGYNSIVDFLPDSCNPIGMVRQVFATPNGVFFSTNSCIVKFENGDVSVWYPNTFFHRTYFVNGNLYTLQPQVGLTYLTNDTLLLAPGGEYFENIRIYSMLPFSKNQLIVATQANGLLLYNFQANELDNTEFLTPFKTTNDNFFKQNWIYNGISLSNGLFAFGTYRGGVAVIDKSGSIVQYIGKDQGIQDETVWNLTSDNQDNIWLALNNGISYSALNSPITTFDEDFGVKGVLQSIHKHNSVLYISSNSGVFALQNNLFERVDGILNLSWDIQSISTSDSKKHLLVATGDGVYTVSGTSAKRIKGNAEPAFTIVKSEVHTDYLYLGLYDGVGVAKYHNGSWHYLGKFKGIDGRVVNIIEDGEGYVWFVNRYRGVIRVIISDPSSLVFDEFKEFITIPNCSSFDDDSKLTIVNDELLLSCANGLSKFDYNKNSFLPCYALGTEFGDGLRGIKIFELDENGFLWFESYSWVESYSDWYSRSIERAYLNEDGKYIRIPTELNEIPRMIFYDVYAQKDGVTWIAGTDGLYRFDSNIKNRSIKIPNVLIRKVFVNQETTIFGGTYTYDYSDKDYFHRNYQDSQNIPEISYSQNSLTFTYSSTLFGLEDRMLYSYTLEGFDEEWSQWSESRVKDYTNLPFGRYTFKVKALSVFNVESNVASYTFVIKRPWYHNPMAYFVYAVLFVLVIILSVKIKTHVLIQSNLKLQELVGQRTKEILQQKRDIQDKSEELKQQKEEIEAQRDELEYQNKQTQASIQYAHTIQQAILPDTKSIQEQFETFILYRPKDVVSGDFYWFSQLQKVGKQNAQRYIFAVVDCTGHGVPGAFMSMIGSRMLSEIINERRIHDPARILAELDNMLNIVLHQDSGENFDGMDVAICLVEHIDKEQYLVNFAGANRPMLYHSVEMGNVEILRGNRKSIGGVLPDIDSRYENKLIHLNAGDSIFLYTDGISDQNNEFSKKFSSKRLIAHFQKSIKKPMPEIGHSLESSLNQFMGKVAQRDDITVMGIRIK